MLRNRRCCQEKMHKCFHHDSRGSSSSERLVAVLPKVQCWKSLQWLFVDHCSLWLLTVHRLPSQHLCWINSCVIETTAVLPLSLHLTSAGRPRVSSSTWDPHRWVVGEWGGGQEVGWCPRGSQGVSPSHAWDIEARLPVERLTPRLSSGAMKTAAFATYASRGGSGRNYQDSVYGITSPSMARNCETTWRSWTLLGIMYWAWFALGLLCVQALINVPLCQPHRTSGRVMPVFTHLNETPCAQDQGLLPNRQRTKMHPKTPLWRVLNSPRLPSDLLLSSLPCAEPPGTTVSCSRESERGRWPHSTHSNPCTQATVISLQSW